MAVDKLLQLRQFEAIPQLQVLEVTVWIEIFTYGRVEQMHILRNYRQSGSQLVWSDALNVHVIDVDVAPGRLEDSEEGQTQGWFTTASATTDANL